MTRSPLGKPVRYLDQYSPELLHAIPRSEQRGTLGLADSLPFVGVDIWNAWELTWLDGDGKPVAATAEFRVPATSANIVESKSLKLYLNSFSMTTYVASSDVAETIAQDLGTCTGADVGVQLQPAGETESGSVSRLPGTCLDDLRVACSNYEVNNELLRSDDRDTIAEELYSHLLRSLCPVTGQPDTGSILIAYEGPRIDRAGLLEYIVSYREHNDFHEACVERMFVDILARCAPVKLTVYARYQRRGGIDINPFRSNCENLAHNARLWRQ